MLLFILGLCRKNASIFAARDAASHEEAVSPQTREQKLDQAMLNGEWSKSARKKWKRAGDREQSSLFLRSQKEEVKPFSTAAQMMAFQAFCAILPLPPGHLSLSSLPF